MFVLIDNLKIYTPLVTVMRQCHQCNVNRITWLVSSLAGFMGSFCGFGELSLLVEE